VRVIAGRLGGRHFDSPISKKTHPMSDKVRGALFNALGDIKGLTVLDAFAGSGALSFEALSRGAKSAVALDIDKAAYQTIAANAEELGLLDQLLVLRKNAASWARSDQAGQYDIVLCDPPYNDIRPDILQRLIKLAKPGGVYVMSWPGKEAVRNFDGLSLLSNNQYGDAQLVFYRRVQ
jgi:16S rRNA (guanine966-N2)-methyltransferase